MQLRASVLALLGVLAGCAVVSSEESASTSSEALTDLPLTPGPLVNAEDNFRCNDIDGTFFAKNVSDVQRAVRFASRGFAIETMADYTGISVAGAVATSAHAGRNVSAWHLRVGGRFTPEGA